MIVFRAECLEFRFAGPTAIPRPLNNRALVSKLGIGARTRASCTQTCRVWLTRSLERRSPTVDDINPAPKEP